MTTTTTRTTRLPHLPLFLSSTGCFPHHHHSFTQPSPRSTARLHRHFLPFRGLARLPQFCPLDRERPARLLQVSQKFEKMGDVSMDSQISKSAEVPGQVEFRESPPVAIHAEASSNGLSESHRQSQSKLMPRQISHPGVTPHSRSPCSEAEEVNAVEMNQRSTVAYELRNPAPSSTTLVHDGAVPPGFQQ